MHAFETVIALLLAGALLAHVASRLRAPYPALLAIAGTAGAFIPGLPTVVLEPELALALFVAPALLDAGYDASPRDLRDNWLPITGLVVFAVGTTVAAVALTARWLIPEMPWAAAIALGAIVAPPDAAAAAAILRSVKLPHRVLVILEGESLLNDATALLIYRVAAGAAATGATFGWDTLGLLLVTVGGGALFGAALGRLYFVVVAPIEEHALSILMQFLGTFAVWLLAERLHLSAIIAVVAYAVVIARIAPFRSNARHRIASYAVWDVAIFVLNVLAFILIGLQLRGILERLDGGAWADFGFALAVALVCIAVRFAWVMGYNSFVRAKNAAFGAHTRRPMLLPSWQGGIVISWCGMRGIVTLAAALALPEGFPFRDLILLTAFSVTLVTLVAQGLTLRWLLLRLGLPEDDAVERETAIARRETAQAALAVLGPSGSARLRETYAARADAAELGGDSATALAAVAAQREALRQLRASGTIGDTAFHALEEEIDLLELAADPRIG